MKILPYIMAEIPPYYNSFFAFFGWICGIVDGSM